MLSYPLGQREKSNYFEVKKNSRHQNFDVQQTSWNSIQTFSFPGFWVDISPPFPFRTSFSPLNVFFERFFSSYVVLCASNDHLLVAVFALKYSFSVNKKIDFSRERRMDVRVIAIILLNDVFHWTPQFWLFKPFTFCKTCSCCCYEVNYKSWGYLITKNSSPLLQLFNQMQRAFIKICYKSSVPAIC